MRHDVQLLIYFNVDGEDHSKAPSVLRAASTNRNESLLPCKRGTQFVSLGLVVSQVLKSEIEQLCCLQSLRAKAGSGDIAQ